MMVLMMNLAFQQNILNTRMDYTFIIVSLFLLISLIFNIFLWFNKHKKATIQSTSQTKPIQEKSSETKKELETKIKELELRLKDKTLELAHKSKENIDQGRLLEKVKEKVKEIEENPNLSRVKIAEVRRLLASFLATDDNTFEIQMDELHQEFFKKLKDGFPDLSLYDLRLCAYLKLGLSSKEIAKILKVLPSSINVSRSRLRKKLNLQPEDDLYEFLNKIED